MASSERPQASAQSLRTGSGQIQAEAGGGLSAANDGLGMGLRFGTACVVSRSPSQGTASKANSYLAGRHAQVDQSSPPHIMMTNESLFTAGHGPGSAGQGSAQMLDHQTPPPDGQRPPLLPAQPAQQHAAGETIGDTGPQLGTAAHSQAGRAPVPLLRCLLHALAIHNTGRSHMGALRAAAALHLAAAGQNGPWGPYSMTAVHLAAALKAEDLGWDALCQQLRLDNPNHQVAALLGTCTAGCGFDILMSGREVVVRLDQEDLDAAAMRTPSVRQGAAGSLFKGFFDNNTVAAAALKDPIMTGNMGWTTLQLAGLAAAATEAIAAEAGTPGASAGGSAVARRDRVTLEAWLPGANRVSGGGAAGSAAEVAGAARNLVGQPLANGTAAASGMPIPQSAQPTVLMAQGVGAALAVGYDQPDCWPTVVSQAAQPVWPKTAPSQPASSPAASTCSQPMAHAAQVPSMPLPATSWLAAAQMPDMGKLVKIWAGQAFPGNDAPALYARYVIHLLFKAVPNHCLAATELGTVLAAKRPGGLQCRLRDAISNSLVFERSEKPPSDSWIKLNLPGLAAAAQAAQDSHAAVPPGLTTPQTSTGAAGSSTATLTPSVQNTSHTGPPVASPPASVCTDTSASAGQSHQSKLARLAQQLYPADTPHRALKLKAVALLAQRRAGEPGARQHATDNSMPGPQFGAQMNAEMRAEWSALPAAKRLAHLCADDRYLSVISLGENYGVKLDAGALFRDAHKGGILEQKHTPAKKAKAAWGVPLAQLEATTPDSSMAHSADQATADHQSPIPPSLDQQFPAPHCVAGSQLGPGQTTLSVPPLPEAMDPDEVSALVDGAYLPTVPWRQVKVYAVWLLVGHFKAMKGDRQGLMAGPAFGTKLKAGLGQEWDQVPTPKLKTLCEGDPYLVHVTLNGIQYVRANMVALRRLWRMVHGGDPGPEPLPPLLSDDESSPTRQPAPAGLETPTTAGTASGTEQTLTPTSAIVTSNHDTQHHMAALCISQDPAIQTPAKNGQLPAAALTHGRTPGPENGMRAGAAPGSGSMGRASSASTGPGVFGNPAISGLTLPSPDYPHLSRHPAAGAVAASQGPAAVTSLAASWNGIGANVQQLAATADGRAGSSTVAAGQPSQLGVSWNNSAAGQLTGSWTGQASRGTAQLAPGWAPNSTATTSAATAAAAHAGSWTAGSAGNFPATAYRGRTGQPAYTQPQGLPGSWWPGSSALPFNASRMTGPAGFPAMPQGIQGVVSNIEPVIGEETEEDYLRMLVE